MENNRIRLAINDEDRQLWRQKPCSSLQPGSCEPGRAIAKTKNRQIRQLPPDFMALDHTQTHGRAGLQIRMDGRSGLWTRMCPDPDPIRAGGGHGGLNTGWKTGINVHTDSLALAHRVRMEAGINAGARLIKMSCVFTLLRGHYWGRVLLLSFLLFSFFSGLQSQSLNQRLEAVLAGEKVNADREFSALTRAKAEEFDETSKSLLLQIVASENIINQADYILLAGFLYGEELLPFVPASARASGSVKRAINLAKVRAGNEERTANLLKNVARIPLNDDFVYTVTPMLIYTRQRAVLDYLLELVMISNSNCTPGDAETSGQIDCGYRLIEHLAVAIAEFPVAVDEDGDLLDNDYAAALIKVREWIALNKPYYTILTNTY